MNKLAPPKRKFSPKEFAEEREYNWRRMVGHSEEIGRETDAEGHVHLKWNHIGGIMQLAENRKASQTDIWWAKRFCRSVLVNPHNGDTATAIRCLTELNRWYPDPDDVPKRRKRQKAVVKKKKSRKKLPHRSIAITKNLLRGCRKRLKELEPKSLYWERRLHSMAVSNPKWRETMDKVKEIRNEQQRLNANVGIYKQRLEEMQ